MIYNLKKDELSTECDKTLKKYFPGALKGSLADKLVANELEKRGFTDDNTLFADSSCPDEINHDDPLEDITSLF